MPNSEAQPPENEFEVDDTEAHLVDREDEDDGPQATKANLKYTTCVKGTAMSTGALGTWRSGSMLLNEGSVWQVV